MVINLLPLVSCLMCMLTPVDHNCAAMLIHPIIIRLVYKNFCTKPLKLLRLESYICTNCSFVLEMLQMTGMHLRGLFQE